MQHWTGQLPCQQEQEQPDAHMYTHMYTHTMCARFLIGYSQHMWNHCIISIHIGYGSIASTLLWLASWHGGKKERTLYLKYRALLAPPTSRSTNRNIMTQNIHTVSATKESIFKYRNSLYTVNANFSLVMSQLCSVISLRSSYTNMIYSVPIVSSPECPS